MTDLEELLARLEAIILQVAELAESGGGVIRARWGQSDSIGVTTSIRVGFLDEMTTPSTLPPSQHKEPLVDVLRTKEGLKVVITVPGVSKENIRVRKRSKSLVFEIGTRDGHYEREVPCPIPPSRIAVRSVVENNSVVEITFTTRRVERR